MRKSTVIKSTARKSTVLGIFTILAIALPQKAIADEVWTTEEYDVVYQENRNNTAVWTYGEGLGTIFIDGLAGIYSDRGTYSGYWVQETSSLRCDTFREGADGEPTYHWGSFDITFINPDFSSEWEAEFDLCDRTTTIKLTGTPVTP